ncbi:MAG: hypothetical protein ACK2T3_06540, partial [Candidatus Promineifilaceae bacterium]
KLTAWLVLSIAMVAILDWEASDEGLETSQWFWLIAVAVIVAGLCIWIISWGDEEEEEEQLAKMIEDDILASEKAAAEEE